MKGYKKIVSVSKMNDIDGTERKKHDEWLKQWILGKLKTNLSANKRNELLTQYNNINN
jgi:hypothetical protein